MDHNKKTEEQTSNKVLTVFVLGAITLCVFYYLFRFFDIPTSFATARAITFALLAVCAVGLVWSFVRYMTLCKKGAFSDEKVLNPLFLSVAFLIGTVCSVFMALDYLLAMRFIYLFIPAFVVYFLFYNVYQRSFFYLSLTHGIIALIIYAIYRKGTVAYRTGGGVAAIAICVAAVVIASLSRKNGTINIGKKKVALFERAQVPSFTAVCVIYGVTALLALASIFLPVIIINYIFYAFIAFIVCSAVYFTFRLI